MPFDNRHDLTEDILHVNSVLLGVLWRYLQVLHLRRGSILLQLIDLATLMLTAKKVVRNLIKQVSKNAGVSCGALLQGSLKLLNFVLSELVRN